MWWNIYMIFAEKSWPAFSELFNSPFWFCLHSYVFKSSTGIFGPRKIYVMIYLHDFCRKEPAGIFGTFLFSIRISPQLLCQQNKWPAFFNLSNFKKRFLQKKPAGIFGTFLFSIWISQQLFCQQYRCRHFLTFQTSKKDISTEFLQKKPAGIFGTFLFFFLFFCNRFYVSKISTIQWYELLAFMDLSNFKKWKIYTIFAEKAGRHFRNFSDKQKLCRFFSFWSLKGP